jgi:hypothetical protein
VSNMDANAQASRGQWRRGNFLTRRTPWVRHALGAALVGCFAQPAASQQQIMHRVVSADSGWQANGKRLLRGMQIRETDLMSADTAGDLILECSPQNELRLYSCAKGACNRVSVCSTSGQANPGVVERPIGKLMWSLTSLLTREPRQPVLAAARAGGDPNDAVLRLDPPRLHLGPALTRVLEGRYCFLLGGLPSSSTSPATVTLDWDRAVDSEGVSQATGVAPGLYSLQKGTPMGGSCQADTDGTTAWVLIAGSDGFASLDTIWMEQSAIAADLERSGASRSAVATVRHAALAALAERITRR